MTACQLSSGAAAAGRAPNHECSLGWPPAWLEPGQRRKWEKLQGFPILHILIWSWVDCSVR